MARIKSKTEEASMDIPMTPMIDVIFQLMIFFMCSIHFKSLEGKLYSYLPKDKGMNMTVVTDPILDEVRISLVYNESKPPYLAEIKIGQQSIPDWDALKKQLATIWEGVDKTDVDRIIPFKIDPKSPKIPVQSIVKVLDICNEIGVRKVEFAAKTTQ
ncbi:MAG: biopolymer transporter ExbD [Planctomycetes bacterium]|nr:biopolymer transporter ExbD [Planctomycetota bacterium]